MRTIVWLVALVACSTPGPKPLAFGRAVCDHCHMTLEDRRFGAELVLRTGKVVPYDDPGCLAAGVATIAPSTIHSLWVADYLEPDSLRPVDGMVFLKSDRVRSPMGYGIVAVRPGPRADSLMRSLAAAPMRWAEVLVTVRQAPR